MKKIIFFTLTVTVMILCSITAFASPCCNVWVQNITEDEDTTVFTLEYNTVTVPRDIKVDIRNSENKRISAATVTVTDAEGTVDAYFESSEFIRGESYDVNVSFQDSCEWNNCNEENSEFPSTKGLELIDFSGQAVELSAGEMVAFRLKAGVEGFYDFGYNCDIGYISASKYGGGILPYGTNYYSAGEEFICVIESDTYSKFNLIFKQPEITEAESLVTGELKDNDKLFSVDALSGVKKITLPVSGVYGMVMSAKKDYESFRIMQGEEVCAYVYDDNKFYLEAGTYYVITSDADEGSYIDIYYTVPTELELDKSYNVADCEGNFYNLSLKKPTQLELTNTEAVYIEINSLEYDFSLFLNDGIRVYPAGDYYLYVVENEEEVVASFEILSTELESVVMNEASEPTFTDKSGNFYYAFCAPETAEYVFDFSQSANRDTLKCFYMSDYEFDDIIYKEMEAGEWIDISVEEICVLKISEAEEPDYKKIMLDTPTEQICVSGQRFYYSFTAEATESYRLNLGFDYSVKLYTENEILFSGRNDGDLTFDLDAGETVYMDLEVISVPDDNTDEIKISGKTIKVQDGETFNLNQTTPTEASYAPAEAGLYRVSVSKYGSSDYISFYINGGYGGYIGQYAKTITVDAYLKEDSNIFEFDACGEDTSCTAIITAVKLETESIKASETKTVETDVYYEFVPSESNLYLVTGLVDNETNYDVLANVILSDGGYPVISFDERTAIGVYSGEKYYLSFDYAGDVTLSAMEAKTVTPGTTCTAEDDFTVFKVNAETAGDYRVESERSNSELRILYDGEWTMIAGTYSNLFKLDAGVNFIVAIPKRSQYEEDLKISASINVKKSESAKGYSVSIEEVSALPGMEATVKFLIQAPENCPVEYGFEYIQDGITQTVWCGYEAMYCSDKRYSKLEYAKGLEYGKTYTLRPFLLPEESGEKIYGEEVTVTVGMPKDVIQLENNKTSVAFKSYDDYSYMWRDYTISFVQPKTEKVYITVPSFIEEYWIMDESYNDVYYYTDESGNYYNLTEGTTYYIMARCTVDAIADITVSSLPEKADVTIENATADIENNSISFTVSGDLVSGSLAYGAVYDSLGRMLEIKAVAEPEGEETISFNNLKSASYCNILYVMQDSLKPLCENAYLEIVK